MICYSHFSVTPLTTRSSAYMVLFSPLIYIFHFIVLLHPWMTTNITVQRKDEVCMFCKCRPTMCLALLFQRKSIQILDIEKWQAFPSFSPSLSSFLPKGAFINYADKKRWVGSPKYWLFVNNFEVLPEHINNSHYGNGVPATFTS